MTVEGVSRGVNKVVASATQQVMHMCAYSPIFTSCRLLASMCAAPPTGDLVSGTATGRFTISSFTGCRRHRTLSCFSCPPAQRCCCTCHVRAEAKSSRRRRRGGVKESEHTPIYWFFFGRRRSCAPASRLLWRRPAGALPPAHGFLQALVHARSFG